MSIMLDLDVIFSVRPLQHCHVLSHIMISATVTSRASINATTNVTPSGPELPLALADFEFTAARWGVK